mmetsp:Transcript_14033/g.43933  ORF Transcript_14033/g.43933 Transcript_14033/m.43933 type:complete len:253 (-) Transcript_14033:592-1350(-)
MCTEPGMSGWLLHISPCPAARLLRAAGAAGSRCELDVVKEPHAAEGGRDGDHTAVSRVDGFHLGEVRRVAQQHVVDLAAARTDGGLDGAAERGGGGLAAATGVAVARGEERRGDARRPPAVVRREARVAARERQPIGVAHVLAAKHFNRHVEVTHHAPHDAQLLVVLFAKYRHIRLDHVEQLGHHRRHAVEVMRPAARAEAAAQPRDRHRRLVRHRVVRARRDGAAIITPLSVVVQITWHPHRVHIRRCAGR